MIMERLMATCALLGSGSVAVTVACLGAAALLFAAIALGFGPLRAWLAGAGAGRAAARGGQGDRGLLDTWRLYRRLRPATQRGR